MGWWYVILLEMGIFWIDDFWLSGIFVVGEQEDSNDEEEGNNDKQQAELLGGVLYFF